jgi:hypothetical protein
MTTRKAALAFGIGATLILAAGTASADCAADLVIVRDALGVSANAGDTTGSDTMTTPDTTASTGTTADTTTGTTTGTSTGSTTDTTASTDNTTGSTTGSGTEQNTAIADSGTTGMTGSTGTVTETSRSGQTMTGADRDDALVVLGRAQVYSEKGDETTCVSELQKVKQKMNLPAAQ